MILFSFGVLISGYSFGKMKNAIASVLSFVYLCISPNMFFMASNSNTQLFFFFLILLFIVLKNYSGKFYQLILIGLILSAEMYIRFNFLMIIVLILFIEKHSVKINLQGLGKLGLVYLSFLYFLFPWVYRNYKIYGTIIRLMPTSGLGLYSNECNKRSEESR